MKPCGYKQKLKHIFYVFFWLSIIKQSRKAIDVIEWLVTLLYIACLDKTSSHNNTKLTGKNSKNWIKIRNDHPNLTRNLKIQKISYENM